MYRQLFRSRRNKIFGGVAGGLGDYFEIDPVIIRAIFVVATIGWGFGIFAYILLWIIVPMERIDFENIHEKSHQEDNIKRRNNVKNVVGIALISFGALFFLKNLFPFFDCSIIWPIFMIALGGFILYTSYRVNSEEPVNE